MVAILGTIVFACWTAGATPPTEDRQYVNVAVDLFNISAILCLFYILYDSEKKTASQFGAIIRDNISTIIVALLMVLIKTTVDLIGYFA